MSAVEVSLLLGDCVERMREMDDSSIDAVVCDPPYLIGFMGKEFDSQHKTAFVTRRSARRAGASRRSTATTTPRTALTASGTLLSEGRRAQEWHERWAREALRVLKPGGHLLAFGGTRTYHRLACGLEDAGFEVRDCLAWMFGQGFPKSLDVSRALDERHGVEGGWRQEDHPGRAGTRDQSAAAAAGDLRIGQLNHRSDDNPDGRRHVYEPGSEEARRWKGWGTALKPAFEPVVVARKPLTGTVADNVLEYGTGAINVDGCRVRLVDGETVTAGLSDPANRQGVVGQAWQGASDRERNQAAQIESLERTNELGRWPANVALGHSEGCVLVGTREVRGGGHTPASRPSSTFAAHAQPENEERSWGRETVEAWECAVDCPVRLIDEQSGQRTSGKTVTRRETISGHQGFVYGAESRGPEPVEWYGDTGGASRFFYCAKTSRSERNAGLDGFEERMLRWSSGDESPGTFQSDGTERSARNHHPTVKPIALMRWLIRLVTPPGGVVLDPFLGSGSTGCAAVLEPCVGRFVGIERDPDYLAIAEARVRFWAEHGEQALDVVQAREQSERRRREAAESGQLDLLAGT